MSRFELVGDKEKLMRGGKGKVINLVDHVADLNVLKDTETGVLYAIASSSIGSLTMTHLVDRDGKPLVDMSDEFNF